jgi:flagellar hook-associated protein 3 FlgL
MKTTYVSTYALSNATRRSVLEMQSELMNRQMELSTGRVADAGLALGARTGQTVALRQEHASLQTIIDSNAMASSRLNATQAALGTISEEAHQFLAVLVEAASSASNGDVTMARAQEKLASMIGELNATHSGEHLFAGINTSVAPLGDYEAGSAAKQAVDDAFVARFGFTQSDPAAATISAADMRDFLDNDFAALFDDTGWATNWSTASDEVMQARISTGATVATGVTANQPAMRNLVMSYTMVAEINLQNLSEGARSVLVDKATSLVGSSIHEITQTQAHLGSAQQSVSSASERLSIQMDMVATHIGSIESVDPFEASTQVAALLTQIETSYAMTARLQQLSLLNWL